MGNNAYSARAPHCSREKFATSPSQVHLHQTQYHALFWVHKPHHLPVFLGNDVLIFLWLVYVDLIAHKYSEYDFWLPYAYLAWGWNILNCSFVVITISVNKSWYKSLKAVDQKLYSWTCNTDILQWWHHLVLYQCSFHCNLANYFLLAL